MRIRCERSSVVWTWGDKEEERLTGLQVKRSGAQEQPSVILNLNRLSCLFNPGPCTGSWVLQRERERVESPKLAIEAVSRSRLRLRSSPRALWDASAARVQVL